MGSYLTTSVEFDVVAKGAKVLEVGCGAGVPGIVARQLGAEQVDFQVRSRFE